MEMELLLKFTDSRKNGLFTSWFLYAVVAHIACMFMAFIFSLNLNLSRYVALMFLLRNLSNYLRCRFGVKTKHSVVVNCL